MIYLLQSGDFVKIGYTENIERRLKEYNTTNPNVKLLGLKDGDLQCEKFLHRQCKPYKHAREWFKNCPEVRKIFDDFDFRAYLSDIPEDYNDLKTRYKFIAERYVDALKRIKILEGNVEDLTNEVKSYKDPEYFGSYDKDGINWDD